MKTTDELAHEISRSDNILDYFAENRSEMQLGSLPEYLESWLKQKGCSKADVVRRSNLNKAYVLPPSVIVGKQTALCVGGSRGYLAQAE